MALTPSPAKYLPPVLPRMVERCRLLERLRTGQDLRVVLTVGQPAQGKSTLIASYLAAAGMPVAWSHLDRESADAAGFFALLIHALDRAVEEIDCRPYLKALPFTLGPRQGPERWREHLSHLLARLPKPSAIVLDGIDGLGPQATALDLIADLLDGVPDGVQLHLISRQVPPFKLQRLKMRQQLLALDNEDLSFDPEEIRQFFSIQCNLQLTDDQLQRIRRYTGGWVGGLVLIGEALGRLAAHQRAAFIADGLPDLMQSDTVAYFSEEIFAAQSRPIQSFLMRTSLLDVIEPDVAARLTGLRNARGILEDLVARNVFIQALHEGAHRVSYRYNHLFRDFLQRQFRSVVDAAQQARLLRRVGESYIQRGFDGAAVDYFLRAGAFDLAAEAIKEVAVDMSIGGRDAELARWIAALPEDCRTADPWLILWHTVSRRRPGEVQYIEALETALSGFTAAEEFRGRCMALAYLIEAGVFQGADVTRLVRWLDDGEQLLKQLAARPYYVYAKALLWVQLGFGHTFGTGDLHKGLSACRNAAVLARRIGDAGLELNATIISVSALATMGEFVAAEQALARSAGQAQVGVHPEYRALHHLVQMELALYKGDLAEAGRHLDVIRHDIETFGLLFLYPVFVEAQGLLQVYQGSYVEADASSRHLSDVAVMTGNRRTEAQALRLRAQVHYYRGAFDAADRDVNRALACLAGLGGCDFNLPQARLLQGIVAWHRQDLDVSRRALEAAHDGFRQMALPIAMAESHLAQGLLANTQARHADARRHLAEGLGIVLERGYRHLVVLRPADLSAACRLALDLPIGSRVGGAHRLLAVLAPASPAVDPAGSGRPAHPPVMMSAAAHRSRLPRLEIVTFGGFAVMRDGRVAVTDAEWHGHQPKLLLKAIVVHGGRDVPKDILIDDLWPDTSPATALRRFKVTLHRLRLTLEPAMGKRFGWAYIHLKDNLVSLDRELCRIDVAAFHELCRHLRRIDTTDQDDAVLSLCQQARHLYRGDFLPEEPYAPWIEVKRSMLRDDYLQVLVRLVDLLDHRGQAEAAIDTLKVMARIAPTRDDIQRRLMQCYVDSGTPGLALAVYQNYHALLASDLGVAPDDTTTALYERLLADDRAGGPA